MKHINKKVQLLVSAKESIKDSRKWNKGCYGKDVKGKDLFGLLPWRDNSSEVAYSMCLMGSIYRSKYISGINDLDYTDISETIRSVAKEFGYDSSIDFNDDPETTHDDVMRFLDRCIEILM